MKATDLLSRNTPLSRLGRGHDSRLLLEHDAHCRVLLASSSLLLQTSRCDNVYSEKQQTDNHNKTFYFLIHFSVFYNMFRPVRPSSDTTTMYETLGRNLLTVYFFRLYSFFYCSEYY